MSDTSVIRVGTAYDVVIGPGVIEQAITSLPTGAVRVLLVHAPPLRMAASSLADQMSAHGLRVIVEELPDAEAAKTSDVLARLWARLGQEGFTRTDCVVTLGGGATTDLGGFVAASWLRGVAVVHIPTTLLAMVDAAVGGKTGINTAEGKNLVGAFWEPAAVICDLSLLRTLPHADLVAGMAEVVKCGFIRDPEILTLVEASPEAALDVSGVVLPELVHRAIQVKADVVAADLRESSLREILNYGHTFGHAIEQVEHFGWRHGDAVAVGMMYAAQLARLSGHLSDADVERHLRVLRSLGLPTSYESGRWDELRPVMGRDKKARGTTVRFVVLDAIAQPTRLVGPSEETMRAAYDLVSD